MKGKRRGGGRARVRVYGVRVYGVRVYGVRVYGVGVYGCTGVRVYGARALDIQLLHFAVSRFAFCSSLYKNQSNLPPRDSLDGGCRVYRVRGAAATIQQSSYITIEQSLFPAPLTPAPPTPLRPSRYSCLLRARSFPAKRARGLPCPAADKPGRGTTLRAP